MPRSFNDAQKVADSLKSEVPVIVNLQTAESDLAKRLIDFSSGLTYALDGSMQRVADRVFLLDPRQRDGHRRGQGDADGARLLQPVLTPSTRAGR